MRSVTTRLLVLLAVPVMVLAACTDGDGGGEGPLAGVSFSVGSKEFGEQLLLGHMTALMLQDAGAEVSTDNLGIQGTVNVRAALEAGDIDMYWEYTGTGWTTLLEHDAAGAPRDSRKLFEAVAEEDLQANQVKWLDPAALNDTYAIGTTTEQAERLGIGTLSEYAELVGRDPAEASLCAAAEFLTRTDGWPGVERTYGFDLPDQHVTEVELALVYREVDKGKACNFAGVFSTNGNVAALGLTTLEDDRNHFLPYNAALTMREEIFTENEAIADVIAPLTGVLDNETMLELNEMVTVEGREEAAVAREFLEASNLISA